MTEENLSRLQEQLLDAAARFGGEGKALGELLSAMASDVQRATEEPLEIFPVAHHSPASAIHMVRRLQQQPPRVIYMELCEDLLAAVPYLADCRLPVALQAFTAESVAGAFPPDWAPLSVVAPLTESSAEYQALAFALQRPDVALVFVDRAVDFVFQWLPEEAPQAVERTAEVEAEPREGAELHGSAIGIEVGALQPTFEQFLSFLLRNAKVRHFNEWWEQYVERAIIDADYEVYRQVMFLVGSLLRRLGRREDDLRIDRRRERYMWTRIKEHLAQSNTAPDEALYICGASHTASDVAEFGVASEARWQIPARTETHWLYGLVPSSFVAIESQFSQPPGTISLAEATWQKMLKASKLKPFRLGKQHKARRARASQEAPQAAAEPGPHAGLLSFLTRTSQAQADEEQLLRWCTSIVSLARKNGYLATTADSIAIYETAHLLANIRGRAHPSPYDFEEAAITCLEKERTPRKRNVRQLCHILLGGDRLGVVGYKSLPPLAQQVYDRLAPLGVDLLAKTNQRALLDFRQAPELMACSHLLWRLNFLLGSGVLQPIMGQRTLGHTPLQESWEVRIGKYQGALIQLAYEGISVEQVLEQRLTKAAHVPEARAGDALHMAENSLLYMESPRLTATLGMQATRLLRDEDSAADAPQIFECVRRLVHYYRTTPEGLPEWLQQFVVGGYSHYATLLPGAFMDQGTTPAQIAAMLGFIFTQESLALSLGCRRTELAIAVQQAGQAGKGEIATDKVGLLWAAEWLLELRTVDEMRAFFKRVLQSELLLPAIPDYLNGLILALTFAPQMATFLVEVLSRVFAQAPEDVLHPWLPGLILRLQPHGKLFGALLREAESVFPQTLSQLDDWQMPWEQPENDGDENANSGKIDHDQALLNSRMLLETYGEVREALAILLQGLWKGEMKP